MVDLTFSVGGFNHRTPFVPEELRFLTVRSNNNIVVTPLILFDVLPPKCTGEYDVQGRVRYD